MNSEGRWFLKVGEKEAQESQSQGQEETQEEQTTVSGLEFIEHFILEKLSFMKDMLDKESGAEDGPQLQEENE